MHHSIILFRCVEVELLLTADRRLLRRSSYCIMIIQVVRVSLLIVVLLLLLLNGALSFHIVRMCIAIVTRTMGRNVGRRKRDRQRGCVYRAIGRSVQPGMRIRRFLKRTSR